MLNERLTAPPSRWISVTFLQGDNAAAVLELIETRGAAAAIEYLRQRDHGDETTEAALTNGYAYDRIPAGSTDRTSVDDDSPYALTYSARFRYVSLLRRYDAEPEAELAAPSRVSATRAPARPRHRHAADPWDPARGRATNPTGRAVAR